MMVTAFERRQMNEAVEREIRDKALELIENLKRAADRNAEVMSKRIGSYRQAITLSDGRVLEISLVCRPMSDEPGRL